MGYYIGLDGGGTKTKCILTDDSLNPLTEFQGGPSNFLIIGTQTVSETILDLINRCAEKEKLSLDQINSVLIGTTGAGRRSDAELLENDFKKYADAGGIKLNSFRVESDARIALEGAFSGKPGSILIAGTGSIMFGKDKHGIIHRVGGFGRYIGDEGSGYAIGRQGLIAASKEYDGRGGKTKITGLLRSEFNISNGQEIITAVYKDNFDIASAAPLVINAAADGDEVCSRIIRDQIEELLAHVKSMQKLLNEEEMRLSFIGGLLTTDNYYANKFKELIEEKYPGVIVTDPELPPGLGAALMAKNLATG
jgi:N-acetylglucosamine kinase-like BadF-type ATPase